MALNSSTPLSAIIDNSTVSSVHGYLKKISQANTVEESLINISLGFERTIGYFNYATRELNINFDSLGPVPTISSSQAYVYDIFTPLTTGLLVTAVALSLIFTTAVLVLYICYRKDPEVKASSVRLSLCTFVGLYLGQFASLSHIVYSGRIVTSTPERYFSCLFPTYCAILGFDIVLATLLMRLLRVWKVLSVFRKSGKLWTDQVLLTVVGLIVFIKVVILVAWVAADTFLLTDIVTSYRSSSGRILIDQQCKSHNTALWFVLAHGYSGILGICLLVAAIKTRKVKWDNFKDTKKVCVFAFVLMFVMILTGSLWGILRTAGSSTDSNQILGIGYCLASLLCVAFLFAPKVVPRLKRWTKAKASICHRPLASQATGYSNELVVGEFCGH